MSALLVLAGRVRAGVKGFDGADAVLVQGGRIAAVGARARLRADAPAAEVLDLGAATLTPALTDAHLHLLEWAQARREVDLARAATPAEAARAVAAHAAAAPGEWVLGGGWNPHLWAEPPTRAPLDRAVPDRPVALRSHDMHALWVNGAALERAGIDARTPDPPAGRIVRDEAGEPTGLLLENATRLVLERIPEPSDEDRRRAVLDAQGELHRLGIVGVHSVEMPFGAFHSLRVLETLRAEDRLRLRVLQHLPLPFLDDALRLGLRSGFGGRWLRVGSVKVFLDGALGSRTAWLREPYQGTAGDTGIAMHDPAEFRAIARRAAAGGIAVAAHAIGDAAVALALDVLSDAGPAPPVLPHRIEHLQLCPPELWGDAGRAGIVCSMQPAHLATDWRPAERHWGRERSRGAFAFRALLDRGAILAFGSDAPVEPVDPRLGLHAAVARTDTEGRPEGGWFPDQRIGPEEALAAYTLGPARAAGLQGRAGVIAPGAFADLAAWDHDPVAAQPPELLSMNCLATLAGGRVVWQAGS